MPPCRATQASAHTLAHSGGKKKVANNGTMALHHPPTYSRALPLGCLHCLVLSLRVDRGGTQGIGGKETLPAASGALMPGDRRHYAGACVSVPAAVFLCTVCMLQEHFQPAYAAVFPLIVDYLHFKTQAL